MKPPAFDYLRPNTLDEAIDLLRQHEGEAKVIAGGQSLMPILAFRLAHPQLLVDISRIPGLNRISIDQTGIRIGALVRWRDIERHPQLPSEHPLLVAAVQHVAHYQIRNRGTVGGSLAHADPAAELPGIAVACDAEIAVVGPGGRRTIAARNFFTGALTTALEPDELITELRLPTWKAGRRWAFEEFARRRGDFALAGVALHYDPDADGRARDPHIAAIGVGEHPVRLEAAEAVLRDRLLDEALIRDASAAASASVDPPDDIHAPADYRRALVGVLLERALARAADIRLEQTA